MDELSRNQLPVIPNEVYGMVLSYLDLPTIRKAREVSKIWKNIIPFVRPRVHFVCQLTDDTFTFATNSEEIFSCLEVHDFNGKGNEVVTPTNGTGLLFGNADRIQFTGNNIEPDEIPKMMQFAVDSVKMLELKNCGIDTLRPFIQAKQTFNSLQELSITYTKVPTVNDTLALEGLATPDSGPQLPSLKRLKIFLDDPDNSRPSSREIFMNYMAIGKLIVKYRRSLKDIEIKRTPMFRRITDGAILRQFVPPVFVLTPSLNTEFQQCLREFPEMELDKLLISPENARHPWVIETQLMRRQPSLKEVVIDESIEMILEVPDLTTLLPDNRTALTSVKMTFQYYQTSGPVNLEAFRGSPNLKTLWLVFFQSFGAHWNQPIGAISSQFSNVEALPRTISSLHLKCDTHDVDDRTGKRKHQLLFFSSEQITWIINNLRELESFWVQLVLEPSSEEQFDQQNLNWRPNMTLQTFNNLISLPKLRNLKLDMLKINQLQAGHHDLEDVVEDPDKEFDVYVIPLGEIQDYIDVCKNKPNVISVSRYPVQSIHFRFWELTIQTVNST